MAMTLEADATQAASRVQDIATFRPARKARNITKQECVSCKQTKGLSGFNRGEAGAHKVVCRQCEPRYVPMVEKPKMATLGEISEALLTAASAADGEVKALLKVALENVMTADLKNRLERI